MAIIIPYARQTWVDGNTSNPVSAARMGVLEEGILDVSFAPVVRVYHSTTQSATSGTPLVLAFNSERFDQAGGVASAMHDTVTNNSRLTALYAGLYAITCNGEWAANVANAAGSTIQIRYNGATVIARQFIGNIDYRSWCVSTVWAFAVNDYVEVVATQNTGGAVNVASGGSYSPEFMMVRVA